MKKRLIIEALIGAALGAAITFAFTHGNISAALGIFAFGVPAGYFGSRASFNRQEGN